MIKRVTRFIELSEMAQKIINSSLSWEVKFELVFSNDIKGAIAETRVEVDLEISG